MKLLLVFIVLPLLGSFLIALVGKRLKFFSDIVGSLASAAVLTCSLYCASLVTAGKALVFKIGGWVPALGIALVVDGLSGFMLVAVNLISFLVLLYANSYMEKYTDKWKFHTLFLLMLTGMNGVLISGDLFNLYLFLEIASMSGYALVAFGTEAEDLEASFKYVILGSLASIFILLGIGLLYSYTSTLSLADIARVVSTKPAGLLIKFISVLFLAGFGMKAALVPFHAWLADAHSSAPSPVSATLSGVFIKTLGVYALVRVFFNVLGASANVLYVFMILGAVSMVVGAFLAFGQNDIKRMFAYSSISQVGYIFLALGIATPLALLGGFLHLFSHAIFKSLLFLNAGAIEYASGKRRLNLLGGLLRKLPVTGWTSLVGSMSISGIPPFAGFWSKLLIIIAAVEAGRFGFAFVAVAVSIITLAYYLKFQTFAFLGESAEILSSVREVPFAMRFSMIVLAALCIIAAALLLPFARPFIQSAVDAVSFSYHYSEAIALAW